VVVLFDRFNLPESIFDVVFATEQQAMVAKMLIEFMRSKGGTITKTEMSLFATKLHDGTLIQVDTMIGPIPQKKSVEMSYNKRQFYDRILTPMKAMGMIDYNLYGKVYSVSDHFNKAMISVGLLWLREVRLTEKKL
jgi:hypothetical protein